DVELVDFVSVQYTQEIREEILTCCDEVKGTVDKICQVNFHLAEWLADAACTVVQNVGLNILRYLRII
ncbi:MAG: hypothetical protein ACLFUI_02560, partial [Halanaerobiales bacterium]